MKKLDVKAQGTINENLKRAEKNVINFIENYPFKNKENLLKRFNAFTVVPLNYLKEKKQKKYFIMKLYRQNQQKIINDIVINELKYLTSEINKKDFKIIIFKGISLAKDLYDPLYKRIYGDIDVFVSPENVNKLTTIFEKRNYQTKEGNKFIKEKANLNDLIEGGGNLDLLINSKPINIGLDLHTYPCIPEKLFNIKVNELYECSKKMKIQNYYIHVLSLHDRLIQLIVHFTKHYIGNFEFYMLHGKSFYPDIKHLHDIALLIKKYYKNQAKWEELLQRAENWDALGELNFTFYILKVIYKDIIPPKFIKKTKKYKFNKKYEFLGGWLIEITSASVQEIFDCEIDNKIKEIKKCKGEKILSSYHKDYNKPSEKQRNRFKLEKENKIWAEGFSWWNKDYLNINIMVKNTDNVFESSTDLVYEQDSVEIMIEGSKKADYGYLFKVFTFAPRITVNGDKEIIIWSTSKDERISNNKIPVKFKEYTGEYEITVSFPWKLLGIKPERGLEQTFDFAINYGDKFRKKRKKRIQWSSNKVAWFNYITCGKLILR